jgi:hypothetical protein
MLLDKDADLNITLKGQSKEEDSPLLFITNNNIREIIKNPKVQEDLKKKWEGPQPRPHWRSKQFWTQATQVPFYRYILYFKNE